MMTQRQIAESLGVSCATVANILSGKPGLRYSKATRERVTNAALEMGYQQNRASRAIRIGRSNLIGIVHFGAGIEAAHKANQTLSGYTNTAGYDYLAVDMNWHGGSVERILNELIQVRVEGVLISHIQEAFNEGHIAVLTRAGIPVVSINGERRTNVSLICDNVGAAFRGLTRHLLSVGHRRILHLVASSAHGGDDRARTSSQRTVGFREAIEEKGDWVSTSEAEFFSLWPKKSKQETGVFGITIRQDAKLYDSLDKPIYKFCKRLFASGMLPDAIVCTNDMYAMEVIAAGLEYGIRVPEDLAITGYDNDRIGEYPAFGLTTAEQDIEGICSAAMNALIQRIADPETAPISKNFDSKLILRTSCGRTLHPGYRDNGTNGTNGAKKTAGRKARQQASKA